MRSVLLLFSNAAVLSCKCTSWVLLRLLSFVTLISCQLLFLFLLLHICWYSSSTESGRVHDTGDGAGVLHIMDLPRNLRRRVPSEVNTMQAFLMRQLARLDYLQACKPRRAQLLKVTTPLPVCKALLSVCMPPCPPSSPTCTHGAITSSLKALFFNLATRCLQAQCMSLPAKKEKP